MHKIKHIIICSLLVSMQFSLCVPTMWPLMLEVAKKLVHYLPTSRQSIDTLKTYFPTQTIKDNKAPIGIVLLAGIVAIIGYSQQQDLKEKQERQRIENKLQDKKMNSINTIFNTIFKEKLWKLLWLGKNIDIESLYNKLTIEGKKIILHEIGRALTTSSSMSLKVLVEKPFWRDQLADPNITMLTNEDGQLLTKKKIDKLDNNAFSNPKHWTTPLQLVIKSAYSLENKLKLIQILLKNGANSRKKDHNGNSALHTAITYLPTKIINSDPKELKNNKAIKIIESLLGHGASPDESNNEGKTCMHLVSEIEDSNTRKFIAETLIKKSKNIDMNVIESELGSTSLLHACLQKRYELVELFLSNTPATIDQVDKNGNSILMLATKQQYELVASFLNNTQKLVELFLSDAFAAVDQVDIQPIKRLTKKHKDKNDIQSCKTFFDGLLQYKDIQKIRKNMRSCDTLINDIKKIRDDVRSCAIFIDYLLGHNDIKKIINKPNENMHSPIQFAILINQKDLIESFVTVNQKVNEIDFNTSLANNLSPIQFALTQALFYDHINGLLIFLKQKSIPTNFTDSDGNTLIHLIMSLKKEKNRKEILKLAIDNRFPLNEKNNEDKGPLEIAFEKELYDVIKILIRQKSIPRDIVFSDGDTPAHKIMQLKDHDKAEELMKLLAKNELSLNETNKNKSSLNHKKTPLELAFKKGLYDVIKILIRQKSIPRDIVFSDSDTPAHKIMQLKDHDKAEELMKLLYEYEFSLNKKNKKGKTPLELAFDMENLDTIINCIDLIICHEREKEAGRKYEHEQLMQKEEQEEEEKKNHAQEKENLDTIIFSDATTLAHQIVLNCTKENQKKSENLLQKLIDNNLSCNTEAQVSDDATLMKRTPFQLALEYDNPLIEWFIINCDSCKIETSIVFENGDTPAHIVAELDGAEMNAIYNKMGNNKALALIKILHQNNFEITQPNSDGENILHRAVLNGNTELVKWINKFCPNLRVMKDEEGNIPLHFAGETSNTELFEILQTKKTKTIENNSRETPGQTLANQSYLHKYLVEPAIKGATKIDKGIEALARLVPRWS